jgi:hypothetical protein
MPTFYAFHAWKLYSFLQYAFYNVYILLVGYAFLLFLEEISVQRLIESCIEQDQKLYLCVSSPTIKDKPVSYSSKDYAHMFVYNPYNNQWCAKIRLIKTNISNLSLSCLLRFKSVPGAYLMQTL